MDTHANTYMCSFTYIHMKIHTHIGNTIMRVDPVQYTATLCIALQRTATHCNALQRTATHCNALQHTATHCNARQFHTHKVSRLYWSRVDVT